MASSSAIAWMCIALLGIYVVLEVLFGQTFGVRHRTVTRAIEVVESEPLRPPARDEFCR